MQLIFHIEINAAFVLRGGKSRAATVHSGSPNCSERQISANMPRMTLSARNQLTGTIEEVRTGEIMAHVTVNVGNNIIESVITRTSAEAMGLKKGDTVKAIIKSTEVMIQKG